MKVSNPNRPLDRAVERSKVDVKLDNFCTKICPYVLLIAFFIIIMLGLYVMVRYGSGVTGTEANNWYYHRGI